MARTHEQRAAENRDKAHEQRTIADALDTLRAEITEADSVGDTRLSGLFHEARTSKADWQTASAFVNIEDGEPVVDHIDKLTAGDWRPETRDQYDAIVSVPISPFMEAAMFTSYVINDLSTAIQSRKANAGQYEDTASQHQRIAERDGR